MKFRDHRYECQMSLGRLNHQWSLRGPLGGVSFHFSHWYGPEAAERRSKYGGETAGLEIHRYNAADYQRGYAPSHAPCWLLGAPCWHEGESSYATDHLLPRVQEMMALGDYPGIFSLLEKKYVDYLEDER